MALLRKRRTAFVAYRVGIILVLLAVTVMAARAAWNMYTIMQRSKAEASEVQARHNELTARRDFLTNETEALATVYGTEAALRAKYGVAREGETQIILVDDDSAVATSSEEESGGFWATISSWFGR